MAIETRTDNGNFWDWFNIPGLDGKGLGGAIGGTASIGAGLGATYGGALGLAGWLLSELFPKGGYNSKPIPNVQTDKVLPKDIKYGKNWEDYEQMLRSVLNEGLKARWKPQPNYGTMEGMTQAETLPTGITGSISTPTAIDTSAWDKRNGNFNYGTMEGMTQAETLPTGITGSISTPTAIDTNAWDSRIGNITTPATPPKFSNDIAWPEAGKMVETLPLGDNKKLDVTAPITNVGEEVISGAANATATWPDEGKMVESIPLNDTGKLDVTAPIIDVRPNTGTNDITDVGEGVISGAANATATWPNEGKMVESIPPYKKDEQDINWSAPMITDKTNENQETTINPISFDSFYDLIKAEQQERWAREDAIRKETQLREDNAWQRAVEDMERAGVNANLVNAGPAASGGGITTATGMNYSMWEAGLQKEIALLQQSLEQNFKGDENEKDRFTQILGNVLSMFSVIAMFKGKI